MIDPKIISKIQKLLSLGANNDKEHEAAAAFKKAAELAEEHGLALSDMNQETGKVSNIGKTSVSVVNKTHDSWVLPLGVIVGKCFDCELIHNGTHLVFVGTPTDMDMTIWYYKLIRIKTLRGCAQFKKIADQREYGKGVVIAIRTRLQKMFTKVQENIRTDMTKALVVQKQEQIQEYMGQEFGKLGTRKVRQTPSGSRAAFNKGFSDGQTMGLNRGIIEENETRKTA